MHKTQRLFQVGERACSVPVFAALAGVSAREVLNDLPGAALGEITVVEWEKWLENKGLEVLRRDGCQTDVLPCIHLVANYPRGLEDFHWVFRDEHGDVHDPSPVSSCLSADSSHMRGLLSYNVRELTITVASRTAK